MTRIGYIYITERNVSYRKYTGLNFLWDLFMVFITGGFWLIWIFVREMRNR